MTRKKFIAGGCSFTFGHELSDDVDGRTPSKKSWAHRLTGRNGIDGQEQSSALHTLAVAILVLLDVYLKRYHYTTTLSVLLSCGVSSRDMIGLCQDTESWKKQDGPLFRLGTQIRVMKKHSGVWQVPRYSMNNGV